MRYDSSFLKFVLIVTLLLSVSNGKLLAGDSVLLLAPFQNDLGDSVNAKFFPAQLGRAPIGLEFSFEFAVSDNEGHINWTEVQNSCLDFMGGFDQTASRRLAAFALPGFTPKEVGYYRIRVSAYNLDPGHFVSDEAIRNFHQEQVLYFLVGSASGMVKNSGKGWQGWTLSTVATPPEFSEVGLAFPKSGSNPDLIRFQIQNLKSSGNIHAIFYQNRSDGTFLWRPAEVFGVEAEFEIPSSFDRSSRVYALLQSESGVSSVSVVYDPLTQLE